MENPVEIIQNLMYLAIVLVGGVGYWIASGVARADYKAFHVILGMAWFSIIGLLIYSKILYLCNSPFIALSASLIVVMLIALIWRKCLSNKIYQKLRDWNITRTPFGPSETWDIIENQQGLTFHHTRVFLSDGSMLGSNQGKIEEVIKTLRDKSLPIENLQRQIISDPQGNIAFLVTEIKEKNCKEIREVNLVHENNTIELTYIPAGKIEKILFYLGPE